MQCWDYWISISPCLSLQDMGPTSMPSVPLMVGCGVSCTALLILLLIYAAFWRWEHTHMRAHTNLLETCMCLYSHIPKHCSGYMCFFRSAKTPVKPNKEQMVQLQQGVVISYVLTHMADGKIKLMTLQCPKSCCSVHQSVINTYFTCPSSLPPSLLSALQIYPFRAIDHLGEFLPLHPGLQFIDPGGTISNA